MALARWQATIVDEAGNILNGASVEVRREDLGNSLANLFTDRAGVVPTGNPITADSEGFAFFHVVGGSYRITATKAGFSKEWRYVPIGLGAETDGRTGGVPLRFDDATADADPGVGDVRFNNATPASVTTVYVDNATPLGDSITTLLDTFDDLGTASNHGTLYLQTADSAKLFIARVTGSVVDGTGYRKITVTPLVTSTVFLPGEEVFLSFIASGLDGVNPGIAFTFDSSTSMADPGNGDFRLNNATLASVTAIAVDDLSSVTGNPDVSAYVLSWDDSTNTANRGFLIIKKISAPQNYAIYRITGASTDNAGWTQLAVTHVASAGSFTAADACVMELHPSGDIGSIAGKQTIWVPASAMYRATAAAGPAAAQFLAGSLVANYLAFDPSTFEDANALISMPKSWDLGALTARFYWFHPATTTNFTVAWTFYAKAYGDNESLDGASYGGGVIINDTGGTTNQNYISAEGGSFTTSGTPVANDLLHFIFRRLSTDGSDTLAVDALLLGVQIYYTTNANTDA